MIFVAVAIFILVILSSSSQSQYCNMTNAIVENGFCSCLKDFGGPTCSTRCESGTTAANIEGVGLYYLKPYHPWYIPSKNSLVYTLEKTVDHRETHILFRSSLQPWNSTTYVHPDCILMPWGNRTTNVLTGNGDYCAYLSSLRFLDPSKCLDAGPTSAVGYLTFWDKVVQKIQPTEPGGEVITVNKDVFNNVLVTINRPQSIVVSSTITVAANASSLAPNIYFSPIQEEYTLEPEKWWGSAQAKVVYETRISAGNVLKYLSSSPQPSSFSEIGTRKIDYSNGKPFVVQHWGMTISFSIPNYYIAQDLSHTFQVLQCPPETISNPYCPAAVYSQVTVIHAMRSGPIGANFNIDTTSSGSLTFHAGVDFSNTKTTFSSKDTIYGKISVAIKNTAGQSLNIKSLKIADFKLVGTSQDIGADNPITPTYTMVVGQNLTSTAANAGFTTHNLATGNLLGFSFSAKGAFGTNTGSLTATAQVLIEYGDKIFAKRSFEFNMLARADEPTSQTKTELQGNFKMVAAEPVSGTDLWSRIKSFFMGLLALFSDLFRKTVL